MSLKKGIFYTLLTQAPTLFLFFISSTLMTRLLGDEGRGAYALLTNQVALLSMLLWVNLGFGLTYFTSKANMPLRSIVGTASTILLLNIVLAAAALLAIHDGPMLHGIFMPGDGVYAGYYIFVFVSIILGLINSTVAAILLGQKQFKAINMMSIFTAAVGAIGFAVLYVLHGDTASMTVLPSVLWVSMAGMLLISLGWCVLYLIHVKIPPIPVFEKQVVWPIIGFSLVGYLSNMVNLINYRFDVWVVDHHHGTSALGLYAAAVGIGQLLFYIPEPFSRVVQPYLYGQAKNEMLSRYKAVARVNFTTVMVLAIVLALLAPWVVPLLFGEVFIDSVPALRLLLPGIVFSSASKLLAQLVVQSGLQQFNLYATIAGAVDTILLDLLLIPIWGIEGAALTSSISYLVILAVIIGVIRFRLNITVHDLFLMHREDMLNLRRSIPWR